MRKFASNTSPHSLLVGTVCKRKKHKKSQKLKKTPKKIRVPHSATGKVILCIAALYEIRTKTWKIVKTTRHCILVT